MKLDISKPNEDGTLLYLVGIPLGLHEIAGYHLRFLSPRQFKKLVMESSDGLDGVAIVRITGWENVKQKFVNEALAVIATWPAAEKIKVGICFAGMFARIVAESQKYLRAGFFSVSLITPDQKVTERVEDLYIAPVFEGRGGFSSRQIEIVQGVADGMTNAQIGKVLNIEQSTVKTHLVKIRQKLGFGERTAIVAYFMKNGLIN